MENVILQDGIYSIRATKYGFDVYRDEATASVRCARIGYKGEEGLMRAKQEIRRRQGKGWNIEALMLGIDKEPS